MTRARALLGALVVWAAFSAVNARVEIVNPVLLPTPLQVAEVGWTTARTGELAWHVATSLVRVAEGFGIAALAALALGLLAGLCVPIRLVLEPVIEFVIFWTSMRRSGRIRRCSPSSRENPQSVQDIHCLGELRDVQGPVDLSDFYLVKGARHMCGWRCLGRIRS